MLRKILSPDKVTSLIGPYHKSTKLLLPFIGLSLVNRTLKSDENNLTKCIESIAMMNVGLHSYMSISCVISDYIKIRSLERCARVLSLNLHCISSFGFFYLIHNNYRLVYNNEKDID
tara:strand:- start:9896 stop:10246 length:351 start_codon:yes stop_codon:yes gene_type:complete